jgi:protein disulfide-isomerase A1
MKLLSSLLALVATSVYAEYEKENGVFVLTTDNFDTAVKEFDYVLAEFYAPWCGHCKSLAPEYEKAAAALASQSNIALAKIDATVEGDLAKRFGVRGYPTLKWFKKDPENAMEYGGGRKEPEISNWINKKTGPTAKVLDDKDAAVAFKEEHEVAVIGYFPEGSDSAAFIAAADSVDDIPFGITSDADAAKELDLEAGGVTLFKQFDEGFNKYSEGDIAEFVKLNMLAYVTEFSDKTAPKIFGGDIKKHALVFSAASGSDHEEVHAAFTSAAKKHKGQALFVFVDCDKPDNARILEFFGLKEDDCPSVRMIEMGKSMQKFKPENSDLSEEAFNTFVGGVLDGSITRHLMSEDIPEKNDDAVFYLVSKQFEEVCYNKDKAVFVEFYAPWCGHCKQLAPVWDKLGEHFADDESIVIAKSDATANEFADVEVQGFPTLKYFPKGENKIVDYNGPRDLDSFIKFIDNDGVEAAEEDSADDGEDEDEEEIEEEEEGHDEL